MEIINRGRAYSCKFCFYKGELRKVKEHVQLTHISEDRDQYFCQLCKFIGKSERELDRHIMHYAKHKQIRENLEMSSAFRKDPASYWQFDCKRDCTQLSMLDSQQLWGSRMRPKSNFTEITTEVCPVPSTDTSSLYVFSVASVDVSPLGPVALPSPLKSPPCTVERGCYLILRFLHLERERS